jgi:hypothetical protein
VIAPAEFGNIQAAAKLAGELGAALPDNTIFELNALFSDSADLAQAAASSMILIGKPSDFASLADKSQFPSLVFDTENSLSEQSALELVSKPEAGADVGYLAIRGFDASSNRVLLAVLGNNVTGVEYAVNAVTSPKAAENNFVMVVADNVQTGWLDNGIATGEVTTTSLDVPPVEEGIDPVQVFRSGMLKWVVPILAVLLGIMLLFIYIEIRQSIKKNR